MSTATEPHEPQVLPPESEQFSLDVPTNIRALLVDPSKFATDANAFEVDTDTSYQVADQIKETLKGEAKQIDNARLEHVVRPLRQLEARFGGWLQRHVKGRLDAVATYEMKMIAHRMEKQKKAQEAQKEAERFVQRETQARLDRAKRLEDRAALLKTDSAKQRLLAEAEQIKEAAVLMPQAVAIAPVEPQGTASDTRDNWKLEPKPGRMRDALLWLADHPEWWEMVEFKTAPSKRMARQFHNAPERAEPFRIWNDLGFATKRR